MRWYVRRQLPRAGRVLRAFGATEQGPWEAAPAVVASSATFRHQMLLDLSDYFQRLAYFIGEYNDAATLTLLRAALRPGDTVIDGGANIGLIAMFAGACVGPAGRVFAFEPYSRAIQRIEWHAERNALTQIVVCPVALSDAEDIAEIKLPLKENFAGGTLGPLPERHGGRFYDSETVRTCRGDDYLRARLESCHRPGEPETRGALFIKLDVEGFEQRALEGLAATIDRHHPAVVTEIHAERLAVNGSGPLQLHAFFHARGYGPYRFERTGWRTGHRLVLAPIPARAVARQLDVLWMHPQSVASRRLSRYTARGEPCHQSGSPPSEPRASARVGSPAICRRRAHGHNCTAQRRSNPG